MLSQSIRHRFSLPALVVAMVFIAAACGSSSPAAVAEVASLETDTPDLEDAADAATIAGSETADDLAPDEAALQFSQCMRAEGLDFPDLSVNAEGEIELREAFQSVDRDDESFQAAFESCGEVLQQAGFGGGRREALESTAVQDALLDFSACLRADGFDVGDVTLGGPGAGGANGDGTDAGNDAAAGAGAGQQDQGRREPGFGNRAARFAENLGLDYDDSTVAEAVDGCMTIVDDAFSAAGFGQPQR